MILFRVNLPLLPAGNPDQVVSRKATVTVADVIICEEEITDIAQTTIENLKGPQTALCNVSLADTDESGNVSEPRTIEAILADTFAPRIPGEFSIEATGEEADPTSPPTIS